MDAIRKKGDLAIHEMNQEEGAKKRAYYQGRAEAFGEVRALLIAALHKMKKEE